MGNQSRFSTDWMPFLTSNHQSERTDRNESANVKQGKSPTGPYSFMIHRLTDTLYDGCPLRTNIVCTNLVITSPLEGVQSIAMSTLSTHVSQKPHVQASRNFLYV